MSQDDEKRNATAGYTPLGYPQPHFPPPPPPHQAYGHPYAGYANQYTVPPPQGTAYYASAQLPSTIPSEPNSKGYAFARIALIFMIVFMTGSLALSVFTWLILGSGAPEFKMEAFSVPYLNITNNSSLIASWEANITAQNPSHKVEIFLAGVEGSLIYRGIPVDSTVIDPLHLGMKSEGKMRANFSVPGSDDDQRNTSEASGMVLKGMEEDRKSGSVEFDLVMIMEARISSADTFWSRRGVIRVLCGDITVNFPSDNPTGGGIWNGARGECLTYD